MNVDGSGKMFAEKFCVVFKKSCAPRYIEYEIIFQHEI